MNKNIPIPKRLAHKPKDHRGYLVPWFVATIDGKPDFRVVDAAKMPKAVNQRLCWVCGEKLGKYMAFVIGPMCAINRVISEPPSHKECAEYAAQACPFMALPNAKRRTSGLDLENGGLVGAPGVHLDRNPGVVCVWVTRSYAPFKAPGGVMFDLGEPEETLWYAEGRMATRDEVLHSIGTGYPALAGMAEKEGAEAILRLEAMREKAMPLLPPT